MFVNTHFPANAGEPRPIRNVADRIHQNRNKRRSLSTRENINVRLILLITVLSLREVTVSNPSCVLSTVAATICFRASSVSSSRTWRAADSSVFL